MKKLLLLGLCFFLISFNTFAAKPVKARNAMAVTEQALATQIGIDILLAGGNAVDAAVAIGYALAVVNPCCGNIGGGGFMTMHFSDGKNVFINFREVAPANANKNMYLNTSSDVVPEKSTYGYLAVAIPGTVLGFETVLNKYGLMKRHQVMAPAIKLAEQGFILTKGDIELLSNYTDYFKKQKNVAAIFLKDGKPLQVGDRLIQKNLAHTLQLISNQGYKAFYKGQIADEIVRASQKNNGILDLKDFSSYKVEELNPIECSYHNYHLITSPPPSSGGVALCEALNILENYSLKSFSFHSLQSLNYIIEAMRYTFADRNNQLGDPNFVKNPVDKLISKKYAAQIYHKIIDKKVTPSNEVKIEIISHEGNNTTHYSVIDKLGNAVSVTYTLNSFFGAKVIAGNTGFFLNNEMDDFSIKTGGPNQFGLVDGYKNFIQPGKRPLSSMTPTIITQNEKVVMIVGSPGGPRIITSTLLTILNVLDYKMNIQDAVNTGRFHHQWMPDTVNIEKDTLSIKTMNELKAMGYDLKPQDAWGAVEAIYVDPITKNIYGANDKRRPAGKAIGY